MAHGLSRVGRASAPVVVLLVSSVVPALGAGADPVSTSQSHANAVASQLQAAQAQAASISAQEQADAAKLDELAQQYEIAQQQVASLDAQISQTQSQIQQAQARVNVAEAKLRAAALQSYMSGNSNMSAFEDLFSSGNTQSMVTQEYRRVASGNISNAIDQLHVAETALNSQESQLQGTETQARAAAAQVASARDNAAAVEAQVKASLAQASSQVAQLVVQKQQADAAVQAAKYQQQLAAEAAAQAAAANQGTFANVPVAPGAAGAVQAAESQLGVPYVWGGESPKGSPDPGFDCSGLTQWSWRQAGVSLPRTAQEQYDAIPHVALVDLQPGDLVFWNDGTTSVQHVGMYVGNGNVIDAPETGEYVQIQPIWTNGLVGAGRP